MRRWTTEESHSQLWRNIKELGQQADTMSYVQLGQLQAHTNSSDLPSILDLVTMDTKSDAEQLHSNLQQYTTEGHENLGTAMQCAWQLIRQNEETRKDILTNAHNAINDNMCKPRLASPGQARNVTRVCGSFKHHSTSEDR